MTYEAPMSNDEFRRAGHDLIDWIADYWERVETLPVLSLSLIHISEPTRPERISYAVFCLKKKK